MKTWFCVQTKRSQEITASVAIAQQGFETFLPLHRYVRVHNHRREEVDGPLFPRYIFTMFDRDKDFWVPIKNTRGVTRIIDDSQHVPVIVPSWVIEKVRNRTVETEELPAFAIGQRLHVDKGELEGVEGLCFGTATLRTEILLKILSGRGLEHIDKLGQTREVPIGCVRAA